MGSCGTKLTKEQKKQLIRSKMIDKKTTDDFKTGEDVIKILLLGPGESGKSTLLKQMNNIYSEGYSDDEIYSYVAIIRNNLIDTIKTSILSEKGISGTEISEANKGVAEEVLAYNLIEDDDEDLEGVCKNIAKLWEEEDGLHVTYSNVSMFQLPGSGDYFIKKAKEIGRRGYFPSQEGGQRNERKKWIHCFEDVTCVIFVVALSGYDQFLFEAEDVPRMREALQLFETICNEVYFKNTSIVLFLNKSDIFKEKIKTTPLTKYFEDYKGHPTDFEENANYVKEKFLELNNSENREIYTHITCATNNDNIKHVMAAVTDVFIKNKLAKGGLLY